MRKRVLSIVIATLLSSTALLGTNVLADNGDNAQVIKNTQDQSNDIAKETKYRSEAGLDTHVNIARTNFSTPASKKFGIRLTAEEEKGLEDRFAFQDDVIPKINNALKDIVNDDYTLFIDQKD